MKIPHSWARVERGDIISFRYQGSDGQSTKRTLIVLERRLKHPKTKNFLLHGIQLDVRNVPAIKSQPVLIELFEEVGRPVKVDINNKINITDFLASIFFSKEFKSLRFSFVCF